MQNLLVATDLSQHGDNALARAVALAVKHKATLEVLHVFDESSIERNWKTRVAASIEEEMQSRTVKLIKNNRIDFAINIVYGNPFVEIIRQARGKRVDLVVLGAKGERSKPRERLGTTAEKVTRKGDRPVLLVRTPSSPQYRRIVVPVDFSDTSRRGLNLAWKIAPDAEVHILYAYEILFATRMRLAGATDEDLRQYRSQLRDGAKRELESFLAAFDLSGRKVRHALEAGKAPQVIDDVARRINADLISIGSSGRTGIPYILLGSVAEHVMREAACDVLVAQPEAIRFKLP